MQDVELIHTIVCGFRGCVYNNDFYIQLTTVYFPLPGFIHYL